MFHQLVAIKMTRQERHLKNRELPLMRSLNHCDIVKLLYYFYR